MPEVPKKKINELELTVRTIEEIIPDMPTAGLQKWRSIFHTALLKIDRELTSSCIHQCRVCFREEWGYRDELPSFWYKKGNAELCFEHEYKDAERLLKDAGYSDDDAQAEPEVQPATVEGLKVQMEHMPPPPTETEQTLEDLMDLL